MQASHLVSRFTVWDYVVFAGMLCVSAAIGIYYAVMGVRRKATTDDFLMGGRSMSVFPVALSILASFMSAITLLGTASEMYIYGTQYLLIIFSYCLVIPATAYLYMPIFYSLHVTSAYEYLELRFNHVIRAMGCITFSLQMLIYMAIVLYAPALALSQVTGISVWTSVLSIGIVCTFYTSIGGMKAVVWTDVFQICLMFGSMLMIAIRGAYDIGGMKVVFDRASDGNRIEFFNFSFDPTERHTVWGLVIGCFFTWMSVYAVSQAMVQRYLTVSTVKGARIAIWINLPGLAFLMMICALAGLVMYARYQDCDPLLTKKATAPDQLLPLYVMDILGSLHGIPGLFVSGIFSGALSTVSSGVNSLAAVTLEDIIKRYIKKDMSDRYSTNLTKMIAMSYGLIAIALVYGAQMMGNVLQAALAIFGIVGGPLLGVFTLGIFFPCANSIGAGVGTITSLVACFWIGFGAFAVKPAVRKAPVSVLGCIGDYLNATGQDINNITYPRPVDVAAVNKDILVVYRISYVWYSMIGCVLVVIVGLIVSLLTGYTRPSKVNPRTIHPIYNFLCGVMLPSSLHDKFMVKSADEYDVEHMIELGRSKNIPSEGKDNAGFASSDEKPRINGLVDKANGVAANGIVHRRSMPGVVASSPEMIAFRPVTNEYSPAPPTKTEAAHAYSSDALAMTSAKSAPPALDRRTAGAAATSSAEDVRKRRNVDSAGLSSAPSTGRDTHTKGESDDHDKTPMTTSKEHGSVDSPPSHSIHRSRRSGSSRREKHRRTRHSSSPDSRRRHSSPKREPAGDESATAF
uniref:Sodium-coupled monocarboxylate transporter 1-like n=1 Tax=Rhipicephalus zambeziensis TaxID=60191 RepID=A0A224Z1J3_9ACAR